MYTPRVLSYDSPSKRRKANSGGVVIVTPSPRSVELPHMSKYAVARKLAGRAWNSKYGRTLRSRARAKGSRYLKRAGRRGLSRIKSRRGLIRRGMSHVGDTPGSHGCKHYFVALDTASSLLAPYTLHSQNLIVVPKQSADEEENRRDGKQIDVKGVSVKMQLENTDAAMPKVCNIALIIPKAENFADSGIPNAEFFRGDDKDRGIGMAQANSSHLHNTRPINSDLWHVLWRKRIRLPCYAGDAAVKGTFIRNFKKYIPINRQFRFVGETEHTSSADPYLVFWYDDMNRNAADTGGGNKVKRQQEIQIIFKDRQ